MIASRPEYTWSFSEKPLGITCLVPGPVLHSKKDRDASDMNLQEKVPGEYVRVGNIAFLPFKLSLFPHA